MRRVAIMALSLALVVVGLVGTGETDEPRRVAAAAEPVAETAEKRNGCKRLFSRKQFRRYAREQFHEGHYSDREKARVRTRARCQRSARDQRWAFRLRKRMRAARYHRIHRLCGTSTCNGRLVYWMESRRSGSSSQASCLKSLAYRESGWDERAKNPNSGAYGIPQALPGGKMSSHGSDWATSPRTQIRWMQDYVRGRYGSACAANAYQASRNYY